MRSFVLAEIVARDIVHGLRTMRKSPAFTLTAVLTLALGIGANTAIFTVIRTVLLKPLDYEDPDRLVRITGGATQDRFEEIRDRARSYTDVGAFAVGMENLTLSRGSEPEALRAARVSANFLRILGIEPLLGRSFLPAEDKPGAPPVLMVSAGLWRRRFGGDPKIAGKTATFNSVPYTIVGVLPVGFQFPFPDLDVWVTRPDEWSVIPPASRAISPILHVFGRLKPQVSREQVQAEVVVINRQYAATHPTMLDAKPNSPERVTPLKDDIVAEIRSLLWMLAGAVAFVLMIACANVASLLLARAAFRSREFAVRGALGATRGRLIGQLLTESVVLAIGGGAFGVAVAEWSLRGIAHVSALDLPRSGEIRMDGVVLGFTVGLSIATGILFGLLPSFRASRLDLAAALRDYGAGAASAVHGRLGANARGLLVIGQVALSMVLLISASLLLESLRRVQAVNPGFDPSHLLTLQIALPPERYETAQKRAAFYDQLTERVDSLPGVHSAAIPLTLPMTGFAGSPLQVVEQPPVKLNERPIGIVQEVTPAYFRTLKVPLLRGREFTGHDDATAMPVAVVSESLARRFWPAYPRGQDPVGQHIQIGAHDQPREIVGIVGDVHQASLDLDVRPEVYQPCAQSPPQSAMLAVRTRGDPLQLINSVRRQILAIDPDQAVSGVQTMDEIVDASLGQRRLITKLLGLFATVALLLAMVGVYGVVAYSVAQRTQEVGIRRALGAQQTDILRLVLGQGLGLALAGVTLGIGASFALTRLLQELLFHVSPADPATFGAVSLMFVAVALVASYIPARRATRIDPMVALRLD